MVDLTVIREREPSPTERAFEMIRRVEETYDCDLTIYEQATAIQRIAKDYRNYRGK
ncbi:MAG: hypothetical protein V3V96_17430 [Acidiferrobacterales bacterium]